MQAFEDLHNKRLLHRSMALPEVGYSSKVCW